MFAGLPGIGVGTLFYVLTALWMPVHELARVFRGTSSAARWRRILLQWVYAFSIIGSIFIADRVMLAALGDTRQGPSARRICCTGNSARARRIPFSPRR